MKTSVRRALVTVVALVAGLTPGVVAVQQAAAVTKLTHSQATSRFSAAGVTWSSSGGCSSRTNPTCTSFDQINLATVQGTVTLKQASGCAVRVTGGTETGHASGTYSHWNGYKVDVAVSGCVDGYVKGTFTRIANRGDGAPQWQSGAGNVYANEGNHWDITYHNCGGC